jgi:hypothetical protein
MAVSAGTELVSGSIEVSSQQHRLEQLEAEFPPVLEGRHGSLLFAGLKDSGGICPLVCDYFPKTLDQEANPLERHSRRIHELLPRETFARAVV